MCIDRDGKSTGKETNKSGTLVGTHADGPEQPACPKVDLAHIRRLRRVAGEVQSTAYNLAGTVQTAFVSELILISAALDQISTRLENQG